MKKLLMLPLLLLCLQQYLSAQNINVAASKISFEVLNRGAEVNGTMLNMKGSVQFDAKDLAGSSFEASIDPSTVNTNSSGRDKHLQKDDFFGTDNFPKIKITSKQISQTEDGYSATARLQVRDITTTIEIPFKVLTNSDNQQVLQGAFNLNRLDFKLGEKIGDKSISFDVDVQIYCVVDK
jgi:polyisoprenoid-binding protein YceI